MSETKFETRESQIRLVGMRVADLLGDPRNARLHPPRNIDVIRASMRLYGQQKNIVILQDGICVAGSGWLKAAELEGQEWVDVKIFDGTRAEAIGYGLVDNRSSELAEWDEQIMPELLAEIPDDIRDDIGFSDEEIAAMFPADHDAEPGDDDARPQLGDMEYRIIVECDSESQQQAVMQRLEAEGLSCRAVMS